MRFEVLGFGVWGLGFDLWALGFGHWALGIGLWALGLEETWVRNDLTRTGDWSQTLELDTRHYLPPSLF